MVGLLLLRIEVLGSLGQLQSGRAIRELEADSIVSYLAIEPSHSWSETVIMSSLPVLPRQAIQQPLNRRDTSEVGIPCIGINSRIRSVIARIAVLLSAHSFSIAAPVSSTIDRQAVNSMISS
jgi:hypothetical protein